MNKLIYFIGIKVNFIIFSNTHNKIMMDDNNLRGGSGRGFMDLASSSTSSADLNNFDPLECTQLVDELHKLF